MIRDHAMLGGKIIEHIDVNVAKVIRHHHEQYNGMGYPGGLSDGDIPLGSRIILVADAFDALTTDRPYRQALSKASALEVLRAHAGSTFDPEAVGAMEKAWR